VNISVSFHITISTRKRGRFRMEVEHFYTSVQVERFKIKGKERFIMMEKRLALKRHPWKITKGQFNTTDVQEAAEAIRDIQDDLDRYLNQRYNKTEGYFEFKK